MSFNEVLSDFRKTSFTERNKGTRFERLIKAWFKTDPRFTEKLEAVWMWEEFPGRKDFGGKDIGIDLVAKTDMGDYWAIQCKCYDENAYIDKGEIDSFIAASGKSFVNGLGQTKTFAARYWVSTSNNWSATADEEIQNQIIPFKRITLADLQSSPVDWQKLYDGAEGKSALAEGKKPFEHQLAAISKASEYFESHDRGKLIMACGTGKTYTSELIAEQLLQEKGLVLFMVPSIALLGQTLNSWCADAKKPIKAVCICSDSKASRKTGRDADYTLDSTVDLALPASTDPDSVKKQLLQYRNHDGLVVVFSTYQSVDAVSGAQKAILSETNNEYGVFDLIICDEAHRTTGIKLFEDEESNFIKIHRDENVKGKKRLYMTATPRLYADGAKIKAKTNDKVDYLCSMDDADIYGDEFYRVSFSYAVEHELLTDYKVLVLTVNESDLPESVKRDIKDGTTSEVTTNYDDASRLVGVVNGLSKLLKDDGGITWEQDPVLMKRAVAFCSKIGREDVVGSSKNIAATLPEISKHVVDEATDEQKAHIVSVKAKHIDGTMDSQKRSEIVNWLSSESEDPNECRVVTNVRCLSEGVDVPSLDAVLFLSARNSQVDVVQSVGRVMRNFKKHQPGEKKYGYIIIPIVVPTGISAEEALNKNDYFDVVWSILNALRSHDDRFEAKVQAINLNKGKTRGDDSGIHVSRPGFKPDDKNSGEDEENHIRTEDVVNQFTLDFGEVKEKIYAKLVEKCGDRLYWENWSKEVGKIAHKFIERISALLKEGRHKEEFAGFLKDLQKNINPSVDAGQAVEMLAQHMITLPVFDALFEKYEFVKNNPVSRSMQGMIELLQEEAFDKDTEVLDSFYESVRTNVSKINNLEGKQIIIKNLYEKFFKGAFPKTVEKLGIVYTPVECVDFIIRSVEDILKKEFGTSLTERNVHILDPFTGTGTFITRLLQSGLIKKEDMERKYREEIHCNEIVLLAYYIADVNIESIFHEITKREEYLTYDGICLTDTFQLAESRNELFSEVFQENSERVNRQKKAPVRVIIGNPPYSVGQKSANDNAQNLKYGNLDQRIAETYVANTNATLATSLYDTYIKAFRWASDRIPRDEGGIIAFITNGAWLDGNAQDGLRKCFAEEFSSIYVLNLRGNCRTSGELRRKEGDGVFGLGSRTPIAITILVKKPVKKLKTAVISYYDIGDYLTREQKLAKIKEFGSARNIPWQVIVPNEKHDWINQRDGAFDKLIMLGNNKDGGSEGRFFYPVHTNGLKTQRDAWCYNFSAERLAEKMDATIGFYNSECERFAASGAKADDVISFVNPDATKISWTRALRNDLAKNKTAAFGRSKIITATYRPFQKQFLYCDRQFNELLGIQQKAFPTPAHKNLVICVSGVGVTKDFSCIITDTLPDLELIGKSQCFPLYWYEDDKSDQGNLFGASAGGSSSGGNYIRRDGITDWILNQFKDRFHVDAQSKAVTKEMVFYYVYGILHSPQYRERFASDLKKSLPRLPIVGSIDDFTAFVNAGKKLAELHLHYEEVPPFAGVDVEAIKPVTYKITQEMPELSQGELAVAEPYGSADAVFDEYAYYSVEKMSFGKTKNEAGKTVADKSTISYNHFITLKNIPRKAYEYVVNGKSAIEWIIERYAVTQDTDSHIKNNPNDWSREHKKPRYILDLLLSVINVSVQTVDIVNSLPGMDWEKRE